MLEAVLFDLDDTLLVDEADVVNAFRQVTAGVDEQAQAEPGTAAKSVRTATRSLWRAGPHYEVALRLGISSSEGLAADFTHGHPIVAGLREWSPGFRLEAWTIGLDGLGASEHAGRLATEFPRVRRSSYRLFPETLGCLDRLRARGLRLAIVTNGPPDLQREKVVATGLADRVDAIVISGEIGHGKPDVEVFTAALDALGVGADRAVMVGDSLDRDMAGATNAGIRGVWRPQPCYQGTWTPAIASLDELASILDGYER